jgi:predicted enzyme related to lactoylglutathione lyase
MASQFTTSGIRFSRAILMVRGAEGVANAVNFYTNALSLQVIRHTDEWAELTCGVAANANVNTNESTTMPSPTIQQAQTQQQAQFRLSIKSVTSEAHLSSGYSPILSFDVDDMDNVISKCAQMGAHLDGPIQYPAHGKIAALRSPDGHLIGLYEPTM